MFVKFRKLKLKVERSMNDLYFILHCTVVLNGRFVFRKMVVTTAPLMELFIKILAVRFIPTIGYGIRTVHTILCGYCLIQNKKRIS